MELPLRGRAQSKAFCSSVCFIQSTPLSQSPDIHMLSGAHNVVGVVGQCFCSG